MKDLFDNHISLPNPKRKKGDKEGISGWSNLHAAFSKNFAHEAICHLAKEVEKPFILDPFSGSGTTLQAARELGYPVLASDLDPVAALLTRAKASHNVSKDKVTKLLKTTKRKTFSSNFKDANAYFSSDALVYCSCIYDRLTKSIGQRNDLVSKLIESPPGKHDNEIFVLCSLILSARFVWNGRKSSNPTWYTLSTGQNDSRSLEETSNIIVTKMLADLENEKISKSKRGSKILHHDATLKFPYRKNKPNILVTSPPYLTRIDYIKNHLPEIALLNSFQTYEVRPLRDSMIGTPTMPRNLASVDLTPLATQAYKNVRQHPSYASENYYGPFYRNYFQMLQTSFQRITAAMSEECRGLIVVQQSRYKEVIVDLPNIVVEQLEILGAEAEIVAEYAVGSNYSQLNPNHEKFRHGKTFEKVIQFSLNID